MRTATGAFKGVHREGHPEEKLQHDGLSALFPSKRMGVLSRPETCTAFHPIQQDQSRK